jgi:(E)-4-hydroxy-3-methylbut-2-enyl-diphosphate synthase
MDSFKYCNNLFSYSRFKTREVFVGDVPMGADHPIRVQSMTNTNTLNTTATLNQIIDLYNTGCDYVRVATPGIKEANNLLRIRNLINEKGLKIPLIADVHFNPKVAEYAATFCEKVRINPGNYADKKTFKKLDYSNQEYQDELNRIEKRFLPLIQICIKHNTVLRIGSNHGSLSDRIIAKYGNTPHGMVESAFEFVRICHKYNFHNIVLSMKASNLKTMMYAYRLLVHKMINEEMDYPIHLGVTEAGGGLDGRVKSAIGIGTLLADGIGDTIRVSLTEDPVKEVPFAQKIIKQNHNQQSVLPNQSFKSFINPFQYRTKPTLSNKTIDQFKVLLVNFDISSQLLYKSPIFKIELRANKETANSSFNHTKTILLETKEDAGFHRVRLFFYEQEYNESQTGNHPVVIKRKTVFKDFDSLLIDSSVVIGGQFIDGLGNGVFLENSYFSQEQLNELSLSIVQAIGSRIEKAEFISCPTCGRTTYSVEETLKVIKDKTSHLKGLKIAVMGCIVNGPGEMADADYGYVGSGNKKITLYKAQNIVKKNISEEDAVSELINLIKESGDWKD